MRGQADYTNAYLKKLPLRDEIFKRLNELSDAGTQVSGVTRRGDRYFYYKLQPGESNRKLCVRDGLTGAEKLLVDPQTYAVGGGQSTISTASPSPDGKLVAFLISRSGGEYGEEWHLAGKGKTKPNTWKDFIACAEYLIANKYTSAKHLGIEGGSAGGILISNSIAERPELFGAAISAVGVNNALRMETTANGVSNIQEFGTFKTEEGFRGLLAMDGYHKIKDGVKYPAMMMTHGANDPRVEPWMSAKFAARLQAANASGKPVLLRLDYDAGHGIGSSRKQQNEERADVYAFLLEQLK